MLETLDIMTIGYQDMPDILYSLVRLDKLDTHARDHGMNSLSFLLDRIMLISVGVIGFYLIKRQEVREDNTNQWVIN